MIVITLVACSHTENGASQSNILIAYASVDDGGDENSIEATARLLQHTICSTSGTRKISGILLLINVSHWDLRESTILFLRQFRLFWKNMILAPESSFLSQSAKGINYPPFPLRSPGFNREHYPKKLADILWRCRQS